MTAGVPADGERQAKPIKLVISDVDGTLLDDQKKLTPRAKEAVHALRNAGISFTFISARPPKAMKPLAEELELDQPFAAFNGAMLCSPTLEVISQKLMTQRSSTHSAQLIVDHGLDLWAFVGTDWYATELFGPHTAHHREMLGPPLQMNYSLEICSAAAKIVGVSDDPVKIAACQAAMKADTTMSISVSQSASYYLDVTDKDANKGHAVDMLSSALGIRAEEIATLGDMPTDMLMFAKSGFSVAMGQSDGAVKAAAKVVTAANSDEGFAKAIEKYFLGR